MTRRHAARWAVLAALCTGPVIAHAQEETPNATARLIQLLIDKGVLTRDQAASLLAQAQSEGRASRAARTPASRQAGKAGAGSLATAEPPAPPVEPGSVRVTYVPPMVRDEIAAQVREQVMGEEEKAGWGRPGELPEWTRRITVYGDVRVRGEERLAAPNKDNYPPNSTNTLNTPQLVDFNSINNGSPFDTAGSTLPPLLNASENRTRVRLRARLGVKAEIDDWIRSDIRVATGNDNSPVTTNQTLGQGTNFGKYQLWLDRAYIDLHTPHPIKPFESINAWVGRSPNPFWTTDLIFSSDLNFDGVSLQGRVPLSSSVTAFFAGGAFPVFNTDLNFATNSLEKSSSHDKYLFAGQIGADWKATEQLKTRFAVGLFAFSNIEGKLSDPCFIITSSDACSTDLTRTQFRQFGNTLFAIRNVQQTSTSTSNPEYYGLSSKFDVLDLHAMATYARYAPYEITIEGEFDKNLAFNRNKILATQPVNNRGASPDGGNTQGAWTGGDTAWMAKIEVGPQEITKANQWNAYFGYKYIESDALVDAFNDSDFHFGGTNAKGFFVGADYGIAKDTYLALRWLSAREVSGPRFTNDVVQLDLNTRF